MSEPRTYSAAAKKAVETPLDEVVEAVNAAELAWVYPRARRSRRRVTGGAVEVKLDSAYGWTIFYVSTDDAGDIHFGGSPRGHAPIFVADGAVLRPV